MAGYNFSLSGSRKIAFSGPGRGSGFNFSLPSRGNGQLTEQQVLAMTEYMNQNHGGSLLGSIYKGGKSGLGWALRQISRPSWAVAEGTRRALEGEGFDTADFFRGASRGFQAKKHTTFSDVFKQEGVLEGHGRLRAVAGLGADILTDPTIALMAGATFLTGGAAAPLLAGRVAAMAVTKKGLTGEAARIALREADDAFRAAGDLGTAHRDWMVMERAKVNAMERGDDVWSPHDEVQLSLSRTSAQQELEEYGEKVIQARLAVPFARGKSLPLTPTSIAGKRVAPRAPSLRRTADSQGLIGKVPGAPAVAGKLGTIFKHGFDAPRHSKVALGANHAAELLMENYTREAVQRFAPFKGLTEEQRIKALAFGERNGEQLLDRNRNIREPVLERATMDVNPELLPEEADFLRTWHAYWENMRKHDKVLGIDYTPVKGVYVPHVYTREGGAASNSLFGEIGYRLDRKESRAIDELVNLKQSGHADKHNLETRIMHLAAIRTRRAATAHGKRHLLEQMRRVNGMPMRVADRSRRYAARKKAEQLLLDTEAKMPVHTGVRQMRAANTRALDKAMNEEVDAITNRTKKRLDEIEENHMKAFDEYFASKVSPEGKALRKTPTFTSLKQMGGKKFADAVKHFKPKDKAAAKEIHAITKEAARIRNQVKRLSKQGAHGSKYRALANEAVLLSRRQAPDAKATEQLTKDTSKRSIGYVAQPQGRRRVADVPKSLPKKERPAGEVLAPKNTSESWAKNILRRLESVENTAGNDWDRLRKEYPNPRVGTSAARAAVSVRARERAIADGKKSIRRVQEKYTRKRNAFEDDVARRFDREEKAWNSAQTRLGRLDAIANGATKRNPNIPANFVKRDGKIRSFSGTSGEYAFRQDISKSMNRVERILDDEEVMANFTTNMRKVMAFWKLGVTSINPGYRIRNTLSDLWNMYIAGVPTPRIVQYGAKAAAYQRAAKTAADKIAAAHAANRSFRMSDLTKLERESMRTMTEAYHQGVLSGLFQGDIQTIAKMYRAGSMTGALLHRHRPDLALIRAAQTFNRHGENWGRLTHYLYRRDYERIGSVEAANWVKKAHFDYEELTPIEQQKFKAWLPFYTWTRKNIPYQLAQLVGRPGKYATFPKVIGTSNELATGDNERMGVQEDTLPDWMAGKYAFRVPFGGDNAYMLPQIGVSDLSKLEDPTEFGQLLGPQLKVPYELITGKSMLTGQDIAGGTHPRNPIAGEAASILGAIPGNPLNVGTTSRNVRGEKLQGAGASPWVSYIAGQLPMLNFAVNRRASIKQAQQGDNLGALSYLGGVSMYDRDLETEMTVAQLEWQDTMAKIIRGLRDEGLMPESSRKKTKSPYALQMAQLMGG